MSFNRWPPVRQKQDANLAALLRRMADEIDAEPEPEAPTPKDIYVEGTVIRFTKPGRYVRSGWGDGWSGDTCTFVGPLLYAGIKAGGEWFLTGKATSGLEWDELLDFIGADNYDTVSTFGPALVTSEAFGQ